MIKAKSQSMAIRKLKGKIDRSDRKLSLKAMSKQYGMDYVLRWGDNNHPYKVENDGRHRKIPAWTRISRRQMKKELWSELED